MGELRIGNRERELAMAALDEHLREGRLDPVEYGDRSATAASARFRSELDALFTDLPAPHPVYPDPPPSRSEPGGPDDRAPVERGSGVRTAEPPPGPGRRDDDLPELAAPLGATIGRNAGKIAALVPVAALLLFVLTGLRFPQVFLLVPVALALLGWLGHQHGG